jgi:hypothetical protein
VAAGRAQKSEGVQLEKSRESNNRGLRVAVTRLS